MRTFKAARRAAKKEPVEFRVEYVDEVEVDGETLELEKAEVFTCSGDISALSLSEFARNADIDAATAEGAAILAEIFREAFDNDAEYRRFYRFQRRYLEPDDLVDILGGLVEDFTGRPTQPPSVSSATSSTDGPDSRVTSLPGGFSIQAEPIASSA